MISDETKIASDVVANVGSMNLIIEGKQSHSALILYSRLKTSFEI